MIKEMEMKVAGCVFSWRHVINTLNGATVVAAAVAAAVAVAVAIIVTQFHAQYSWWIQMNSKKETVAYKQQTTHCHQHNANWRIGYIHWALLFVSHSQRSKVDISFKTMTEFWNMHKRQQERQKKPKKKPLILSATNGRHIALVDYRQLAIQISLLFILFITISATTESGRWQGTRRRHRVHVCGFNMQAMGSIVAPPLSNLKAVASSAVIGQEGQEEKRGKKKTRPAFFYPPETRMAAHKRNSDENKSEE